MIALSLLLAAAVHAAPQPVKLKTSDGWTLAALYQAPKKDKPVAILVHGVGAGKGEWDDFVPALWKLGFGTLALDLRGHGESTASPSGPRDYRSFEATGEWPRCLNDLLAAQRFLANKRIPKSRIGFIAGSIGANLASQVPDAAWLALLSPGEDYRGAALGDLSGRRALVAASPEDAYAHETSVRLAMQPGGPVFLEAKSGHGAQLLRDPDFVAKLLDWLKKR